MGPSINNVSSEGEGGGEQKWDLEAISRAKTGATGEVGVCRNSKLEETLFMDVPLLRFFSQNHYLIVATCQNNCFQVVTI